MTALAGVAGGAYRAGETRSRPARQALLTLSAFEISQDLMEV
jgi:hypothetical protein